MCKSTGCMVNFRQAFKGTTKRTKNDFLQEIKERLILGSAYCQLLQNLLSSQSYLKA
jgi:hypothetical protein